MTKRIAIIGAGQFGTAIANSLALNKKNIITISSINHVMYSPVTKGISTIELKK